MENKKIKIVLGTGNPHKLQEIKDISKNTNIEFVLPNGKFDPIENGTTFEQNSLIKAKEAARVSHCMALADDSGLCVEALDGAPGIHSARYAPTRDERIEKLLRNLSQSDNRKAKFVCVMTLVDKNGDIIYQTKGECHGEITKEPSGTNGFGYDPVFKVDGYNMTMAQMSEEQKNTLSHRAKALEKMEKFIGSL